MALGKHHAQLLGIKFIRMFRVCKINIETSSLSTSLEDRKEELKVIRALYYVQKLS